MGLLTSPRRLEQKGSSFSLEEGSFSLNKERWNVLAQRITNKHIKLIIPSTPGSLESWGSTFKNDLGTTQ